MRKSFNMRKGISMALSVLLLCVVVAITCYPFLMMVMSSFKEDYEIYSLNQTLLPRGGFDTKMYTALFNSWPFFRNLANSVIVVLCTTAIACVFCTTAGYTFAKYDFPFKNVLFLIALSSLMIPAESTLVPTYLIVRGMGGVNQYWSLILPGAIPAFGIFMMRQFAYGGVPTETMEYSRIEGASEFTILRRIAFPMLRPAVVSLGILTFMNAWNDYLWPIVITTKKEMLTVTALLRSIGDSSLNGSFGVLMAATTLSTLPIIVIYLIFHKQMLEGILEGMGRE